MLRQNFTKVITSPQIYNRVFRISFLLSLIGLLCIPFVPIMGEPGFISENAVSSSSPMPLYDPNRTLKIHKALQTEIGKSDNSTLSFIEHFFLKNNVKPHKVDFTVESMTSKGKASLKGTNLYGIYRTKRGEPAECNMITFNHDLSTKNGDGKLEIAMALSFLEMFVDTGKVNYNSRDLIFLAYDGKYKTYGRAIQEFLDDYYSDRVENIERCGVIRQAFNIEIDKDDFNRIALRYQGINARVPDLDFYVLFTKLLDQFAGNIWDIGVNTTQENKINTFMSKNYYQQVMSVLKNIKPNMIRPFDATTTIHSMKGLLVGWPHEVHSYLLERGILAITLKGYKCENCQSFRTQVGMLEGMGRVIEGANRACMALQEQLHAASTAWIATSKRNVYFIFGGLTFVILMLLPQILKAVINLYEHGLERNMLRASIEHVSLFLSIGVLYELPRLFEIGWSTITGEHVQICSPYSIAGVVNSDTFLLAFLAASIVTVLAGTIILPRLVFKAFPTGEIKPYQVQQWNTKYCLATGYITIILILWSLSNPVFAFIGAVLTVPVFLCISPIQKMSPKRVLGNVVGIICLVGSVLLITHVIEEAGYNWIGMFREVLMREACNGTDMYKFIVLYIVPCLVFIGQILGFRGSSVKTHID